MLKVENRLTIYEIDGKATLPTDRPQLVILSHWNDPDLVIVELEDVRYTVLAADLIAAIRNATNSARY